MRGDVAKAASCAALSWVGPPRGLLLIRKLQSRPQPALNVEGADGIDFPQLSAGDHLPRLPDQRVAGVVVRDREHDAGLINDCRQFLGLLQIEREWLIADDVKT